MRGFISAIMGFSLLAGAQEPAVPAHLIPVIDDVGLSAEQVKEKNSLIRAIELNEGNIAAMEERIKDRIENRQADPKTDRGIAEIRNQIEYVKKGVAGFKVKLAALKVTLDAGQLAKAKTELAQIAKLKLDAKLSDQRFEVLEISQRLDAVERQFDSSVAAEHLRAKLARVLSSPKVLCPSVQSCQGGNRVDFPTANELLNDVFYNDTGTMGRERATGKEKKSPAHDGNSATTF